jgi:glycosyltransferase involved in cell wall biosynthesis
MNKDLIWFGPPFSYSGYATHNRFMLLALSKLGWNIKLIPSESDIPEGLLGKKQLLEMVKNNSIDPKESICLNLIPPPALAYWGKYTILFTTLESKTVHEGFFRRVMQYDEIWVPCKDNYESLIKAGVPKKRLFLCPEGVQPFFWSPKIIKHPKYDSKQFTFFYCGDWSYRKGIDLIIRAYANAFLPTENVRLLMLTHYQGKGRDETRDTIAGELPHICHTHGITKYPKIEFIFEHIEDGELPAVFNCADIGIFPTRGEAWLLPAIQLMSCGKPVITTNWGGQTDYCNKKNSYLIDVEKFDTMQDKVNLTVDFYKEQLFPFANVEHLTKTMRYCYEHPDEVRRKGVEARQHVQNNFSWEQAAKKADAQLQKIYQTRFGCRIY